MTKDNGIVILAVDPGRTTGWALYRAERLMRFGQFRLADGADVDAKVARVLTGEDGYPKDGFVRPAIAVVEEHSAQYHVTHRGSVGENRLKKSMAVNVKFRRRLEAALLRCGIPSLGVTPEEWNAGQYALADVLAELARAGIVEPDGFRIPGREHQRDAIVLGGRMARRKVWHAR
jgi:hypothetical protein